MILLFDVGNTRIKWAWKDSSNLLAGDYLVHRNQHWGLESVRRCGVVPNRVVAVSVASPAINRRLSQLVEHAWGRDIEFIRVKSKSGQVRNAYSEPQRLGADRWAAIIGAYSQLHATCVIDCGSAVTVDTVTAGGEHLGGIIVPGLGMMRRALVQDTYRLSDVDRGEVTLFARETDTAIRSGTLLGLAAMVDGIAGDVQRKLAEPVRFILTGGDGCELQRHLKTDMEVVPDLVLRGVARLVEDDS